MPGQQVLFLMVVIAFFAGFPFFSAYLVSNGFTSLELLLFSAFNFFRAARSSALSARLFSALFAVAMLLGAWLASAYFVWLVPSFVYLWLAILFGHTLWKRPSLCERFVRVLYPDFLPGVREYLRGLTALWAIFFAVNVPFCAVLPVWFGPTIWAWYTGLGVYVLMLILLGGEWLYRRRRFPEMTVPPLRESLRYFRDHGYDVWRRMGSLL
jgi:uncharacterized membrane protein